MIEHDGARVRRERPAPPRHAATVATAAGAAPAWWTTISRANLRGATLQWATGLFCAFVGAQMLVVPHQFGAQAYDSLRPNILGWGAATLLAGMVMVVVACDRGLAQADRRRRTSASASSCCCWPSGSP